MNAHPTRHLAAPLCQRPPRPYLWRMTPLRALPLLALLASPALAADPVATLDGIAIDAVPFATGFEQPVALASPPGDARLFVVEQPGRIRILDGGQVTPFLDISDRIAFGGEQGLLGLAFHPDFASNQRFFTFYTAPDGALTVAEGRASDPASLTTLLSIPHDQARNHNGGWLGFGPDGLLYIGTGDGGRGGDPWGNAQNPDLLLGKILRIDVNAAAPYAIPPGNPFAKGGGAPEIFALGLRNPWRASFDGNDLYIADVGQNAWEEVNVITPADAGANLGWNRVEGTECFRASSCDMTGLTAPVLTYGHDADCSVTGGIVYRGTAMPALTGRYLFSDFCGGRLMSFRLSGGEAVDATGLEPGPAVLGQVVAFGQDAAGEPLVLSIDGTILRLQPAE